MQDLTLAIFDLDHTLLADDCSARWADYMQQLGWVDGEQFALRHSALMADYGERGLDMEAYLDLMLAPLAGRTVLEVDAAIDGMVELLLPLLYREGQELVAAHRNAGHQLILISASEDHLVQPIGRALGFEHIFGVPCEQLDGRFTGRSGGLATYAAGKVRCVENWLAERNARAICSYFYSDSHNDLPLLEWVTDPRPTNPNALLQAQADQRDWRCHWLDTRQTGEV